MAVETDWFVRWKLIILLFSIAKSVFRTQPRKKRSSKICVCCAHFPHCRRLSLLCSMKKTCSSNSFALFPSTRSVVWNVFLIFFCYKKFPIFHYSKYVLISVWFYVCVLFRCEKLAEYAFERMKNEHSTGRMPTHKILLQTIQKKPFSIVSGNAHPLWKKIDSLTSSISHHLNCF